MNQSEHKAEAERTVGLAKEALGNARSAVRVVDLDATLKTAQAFSQIAQVHATLATIPDKPDHRLGYN